MGRTLALAFALSAVFLQGSAAQQTPTWVTTGPEGGRIYSLATSPAAPNTVYAGTADGEYKSTSFGASWRRLASGPAAAFTVLAVDPRDARRVYAAGNRGVWRSLDGGRSWLPPGRMGKDGRDWWGIVRLAVAPSSPTTLYALRGIWAPVELWRSVDAGRSWRRVWKSTARAGGALDLAVDPTSARRLYLGWLSGLVGEQLVGGGLTVSADGGRTWRRGLRKDIHSLAVDPATGTVYAGGDTGQIYRSVDRGGHWRAVARLGPRDVVGALAIDPTRPRIVYALTSWGVHRSRDGGSSWRLVGRRTVGLAPAWSVWPALVVHPRRSQQMLLSPGEGVWRSDDRARSWSRSNEGLVATWVRSLVASPKDPLVAYAADQGGLWATRDGGRAWRLLSEVEAWDLAIDPTRPTTIYAGNPILRKSTDGGRTWNTLRRGPAHGVVVDPGPPSTVYVAVPRGVVKSTDGGATWRSASTGLSGTVVEHLVVDPVRTQTLYAVMRLREYRTRPPDLGLFTTTDGGGTWQPLPLPTAFGGGITSMAVDPFRPGRLFLSEQCSVYRSDDGGRTWAWAYYNMYRARPCPMALAADLMRRDVVYVGAREGVVVTENGGKTWRLVRRLRNEVTELAIASRSSRLYAATLGSGVSVARLPLGAPAGHTSEGPARAPLRRDS